MFNLEHQERHIKTIRRHWLVFVLGLLPFALTAYLTLVLERALIAGSLWTPFGNMIFPALPSDIVIGLTTLLLLVLWLGAIYFITDFFLDVWIITNERIIGIVQLGLFSRKVNSFRIERIQDVKTEVSGIVQTLFSIGDVHVETASDKHDLIMKTVGSPQNIRRTIMKVVKKNPGGLHDV